MLQKEDRIRDRGARKEREISWGQGKRKSPRMTLRNLGMARRGMELTSPSTRYKASIRLSPTAKQPPTTFAGRRSL